MRGFPDPRVLSEPRRRPWRIDWWLALSAISLIAIGLMSLYSVSYNKNAGNFNKQVVWLIAGVVPFGVFFFVHPKTWLKISNAIYVGNVLTLGAVLVIGSRVKGAQRWVEVGPIQFQPSEMAKILLVITLASFFYSKRDSIHTFATFALSFLHVLPPLLLVFLQPHLGAALVLFVIWLAVSVGAGVPLKFLLGTLGVAVAFLGLAYVLKIPGVFKDYQLSRVEGLLRGDEKSDKFQTSRAEIAFGVGGLLGAGYLKGEQKAGSFIPEQDTDFVFTIIGEEGGFVGSLLAIGLFGLLFFRAWWIMFRAEELLDKMLAAGVLGLLAFHTIVNLSMNLQLIPVVGLWLPFMSYGGTALWLCMSCVGLLLNIRRRERPVLF